MSITPEWIGIGIAALGGLGAACGTAVAYGRIKEKVSTQEELQRQCQARRLEQEQRLFDKVDDIAEGVNKLKGALGVNGD